MSNVEGLEQVLAKLRQIDQLTGRNINKAAKKGADIALKGAQNRAPVRTGALKRDIRAKAEKGGKGRRVYKVGLERRANSKSLVPSGKYSGVPYGVFVEYGHKGPHPAPARPYLKPALNDNRSQIEGAIVGEFKRILEDATK